MNNDESHNRNLRRHPERLLDEEGAARYLGVRRRQVRNLWAQRRLAGVKVGALVRFDVADLDAFIERQRVEAVR